MDYKPTPKALAIADIAFNTCAITIPIQEKVATSLIILDICPSFLIRAYGKMYAGFILFCLSEKGI